MHLREVHANVFLYTAQSSELIPLIATVQTAAECLPSVGRGGESPPGEKLRVLLAAHSTVTKKMDSIKEDYRMKLNTAKHSDN